MMSVLNVFYSAVIDKIAEVIIFYVGPIAGLIIAIVSVIVNTKYKRFVENHSVALKQLRKINPHYCFKKIPSFDMEHDYDNEAYYDIISCKDYLTYQLVYLRQKVVKAGNDALDNDHWYKKYIEEVAKTCELGNFDTDEMPRNKKMLLRKEEQEFEKARIPHPVTELKIRVTLYLTNMNGYARHKKIDVFDIEDIREIVLRLNNKNNGRYRDRATWDAICRVERGKVTNRMRFSIYERDGYRCCKCGRRTHDLEIDHIYPIAKGGKTTYDNLQTLCRKCNQEKGSNIEY